MNLSFRFLLGSLLVIAAARADDGSSICGSLGTDASRAQCIGVINGHDYEPGALSVCGSLGTNEDRVACMRVSADKRYSPGELSTCGSMGSNAARVTCMANAGRSTQPQVREEPRRSRRRARDEDDDDTRVLRLTNHHRAGLVRLFTRRRTDDRYRSLGRDLGVPPNTYRDLELDTGWLQLCAETADGFRIYWNLEPDFTVIELRADEPAWSQGRCRDL